MAAPSTARKRLLVFCDGTNQDGLIATDDGTSYDDDAPLYFTNVVRLSRAVLQEATCHDGTKILQLVYYQSGVGTESDFRGHASSYELASELFGTAVARKIRDAYAFIAQNWREGDEIFLFGFSRGAYTARKVAGLIDRIGIIDIKQMGKFYPFWYALETNKGELPPRPKKSIPIQVVGVWDTVGAIRTSLFQAFPGEQHRLSIHDEYLPKNVRVALHAIAFHENRNWFQCTLWAVPPNETAADAKEREGQIMKQVWFGGEHSDVGGGWEKHELSDISLFWMASEILHYVALDEETILQNIRSYPTKPAWGESIPHNSYGQMPRSVILVGHITPSTRIQGGHFHRDSVFHPSILRSPRLSKEERMQHALEEESFVDNPSPPSHQRVQSLDAAIQEMHNNSEVSTNPPPTIAPTSLQDKHHRRHFVDPMFGLRGRHGLVVVLTCVSGALIQARPTDFNKISLAIIALEFLGHLSTSLFFVSTFLHLIARGLEELHELGIEAEQLVLHTNHRDDSALVSPAHDAKKRFLEGGGKQDSNTNLRRAMGKHMITLDDLENAFGPDWKPRLVELNPLEIKAQQRWMNTTQPTGHQATYESIEQFRHIIHDSPNEASKIHTT